MCKSDIANEKFAVVFLPKGKSDIKAYGFCDIIFAIKLGVAEYHTALPYITAEQYHSREARI